MLICTKYYFRLSNFNAQAQPKRWVSGGRHQRYTSSLALQALAYYIRGFFY